MKRVFIDESGNPGFNLDTTGDTPYFILTAIVLDDKSYVELEDTLEQIAINHFHGHEFKSKTFKQYKNYELVFNTIKSFNYQIFAMVIDKNNIWENSGLRKSRQVFLKYISRKFYELLKLHYPKISINYDEIGR